MIQALEALPLKRQRCPSSLCTGDLGEEHGAFLSCRGQCKSQNKKDESGTYSVGINGMQIPFVFCLSLPSPRCLSAWWRRRSSGPAESLLLPETTRTRNLQIGDMYGVVIRDPRAQAVASNCRRASRYRGLVYQASGGGKERAQSKRQVDGLGMQDFASASGTRGPSERIFVAEGKGGASRQTDLN